MLPFGVTILATVPQRSEIPEGLMNNPVLLNIFINAHLFIDHIIIKHSAMHAYGINTN
jgi:hypothetical protein